MRFIFGWQQERHARTVRVDDFEILKSQTFEKLISF